MRAATWQALCMLADGWSGNVEPPVNLSWALTLQASR
jgi:hypothetical protein